MPKMPSHQCRWQQQCGYDRQRVEMPVAFLGLQAEKDGPRSLQFDDIVVQSVEPLRQLAGLQPQGRLEMIEVLLLEPVKQNA